MESLSSEIPGFVGLVSIAELGWVLNRTYRLGRGEFIQAMQILLSSEDLLIEAETLVTEALVLFAASNADFGDCLITRSALFHGCSHVATFDRKAAKTIGMQLVT
jgi:predicted nucleic-acid-binding protein